MKNIGINWYTVGFLAACLFMVTLSAHAQSLGSPSAQPVFSYPQDPDTRIISYSETPEMLANPDLIPRIQVFGDGRVWVHYPEYMTKAGDYEAWLNPGEMHKLLLALSGVFDFDPKAVKQSRKLIKEARELQTGIVYYRSEDTLEELEVQLDAFQANPVADKRAINLNLSWKNIASDAADYPGVVELQNLKGARNSIRALLERNDLLRIDQLHSNGQGR